MMAYNFKFSRIFIQVGILTPILALFTWASFSSCKTVEIDGPGKDSVAVKDSVNLRVTNQIQQDPDSIAIYLFNANSIDFSNANKGVLIGKVDSNKTATFKVPVGSHKLAYEDKAGSLVPMRDDNSGGQEWLRAIFEKSGDYSLILSTDGNRTIWRPTFKTDPLIQ